MFSLQKQAVDKLVVVLAHWNSEVEAPILKQTFCESS